MKYEITGKKMKKTRAVKRALFFLLFVLFLSSAGFFYLEHRLSPLIAIAAEQKARECMASLVNRTVYEEIGRASLEYHDLIAFEKDKDGKIIAIKTNTLHISRFQSYITAVMNEKFAAVSGEKITIPLGTALGGGFFLGRGPKIKIILTPVGSVATDFSSVFSSAGINQTKHQIMLEVRAQLAVLIPFRTVSTEIVSAVCVAETVIVGDVPSTYADIHWGMGAAWMR